MIFKGPSNGSNVQQNMTKLYGYDGNDDGIMLNKRNMEVMYNRKEYLSR